MIGQRNADLKCEDSFKVQSLAAVEVYKEGKKPPTLQNRVDKKGLIIEQILRVPCLHSSSKEQIDCKS